jgi:ABC-type Fe3+/spermidine/putrescine transport system ATPase subunit
VGGRGSVVAHGVGVDFNGVPALVDADLTVRAGEFFTLLGPSGSGKTTLLRIIAGLLDADRGSITIDERNVTKVPTQKRDIGFVFQNYALFPHLTVAQNIEFGLKVHKVSAPARAKRVKEMVELVALGGLGDRYPGQLSGGQQQRVALGRALAQRPSVLLLDEPLGALDRNLRQDLGAEIRRIQQESGTTAVYVTHDQEEAFILSDRIGVMRDGVIQQLGTPAEIYSSPQDLFIAKFLGKTSIFDGTVVSNGTTETVVAIGDHQLVARASTFSPGERVLCSVRPEQIVVNDAAAGIPAGHNVLSHAVVTESRFLGQRQSVSFDANGTRCDADIDPHGAVPAVGDHVVLSVRPGMGALIPHEATR